ncbi:MAG TPA: ABC transporter substrate-binding protein [Chloroflexota bacterium]|nr:ABC transporter substrate-binding protein [Chloroflexota bacterium]
MLRRATVSVTGAQWPEFVAQAKGFYAREGLTIDTLVVDVRALIPSLIGGSFEISFASATDLVLAIDRGANLVAVGSGLDRAPYALITPPTLRTFADLKGKRVGATTPNDAYTVVIRDILSKNGLDPDHDVEFLYGGSSNQRVAALQSGGLDAALVLPPQERELTERGFHALANTLDYYPNLQLSLTAVRRDWAEEHADVLRRYLRAQAAASRWLNDPANRAEAIQILGEATRASPDAAAYTYEVFVTRVRAYPDDGCIQRSGMEGLLQVLARAGLEEGTPSVEKYIDRRWCPS